MSRHSPVPNTVPVLRQLRTLCLALLVLGIGTLAHGQAFNIFSRERRIEPDFPSLPANHLKFYLKFAQPMERGEVFRHLRLVQIDTEGREIAEVPEPFREVELWDGSMTRMTLWLHPGRQKPGVNLNVEIGPILEAGNDYRLEISERWRDENGNALGTRISYRFHAVPADLTQPAPEKWKIEVVDGVPRLLTYEQLDPSSSISSIRCRRQESKTPFVILPVFPNATTKLPYSLNHSVFELRVPDKEFPQTALYPVAWPPGDYELVIDPKLEDLAGNSIARPFNLDLEKYHDFKERNEPVIIPFTIPER